MSTKASQQKTEVLKLLGVIKSMYGGICHICVIAVSIIAVGCGSGSSGGGDVMPINESKYKEFQTEFKNAGKSIATDNKYKDPGMVKMAMAFQNAVKALGYSPEKTVVYLLSPACDNVEPGSYEQRLSDIALGLTYNLTEKTEVLSVWPPEIETAAREANKRRGLGWPR